MKKIFASLVICSGLIICLPALAAEYYVDGDSGDDTAGLGTVTAPYKTITKAVAVMSGGDTIYCQGTITDGLIDLDATKAGTADSYTTITVRPGYTATINANGNDYAFMGGNGAHYVKINGLNITNANLFAIYASIGGASDYWEITNNNIYGFTANPGTYVMMFGNSSHSLISNNDFDGEDVNVYAIYYGLLNDVIIENNKFHNFTDIVLAADGDDSDMIIRNNWFYNNGHGVGFLKSCIVLTRDNDIRIYNNSFYNNYDATNNMYAVILWANDPDDIYDITFKNNIVDKANYVYYFTAEVAYGINIDNNDIYDVDKVGNIDGVTDYNSMAEWSVLGYDEHSYGFDPSFVSIDASNIDLHLQETSLLIDAGVDTIDAITDYDSETRPYNITDIGADERPLVNASPVFTEESASATKVDLSWYADEKYPVTKYIVKRSTVEDFTTQKTKEFTTTSGTLSNFKAAKQYYYSIAGVYETDYGSYYSDYSETRSFITYPKKIKDVKVPSAHLKQDRAYITWKKHDRLNSYVLKLTNKDNHNRIKYYTVSGSENFETIHNLTANTNYEARVRGRVKSGNTYLLGKWSAIKEFKTLE
ncbi:MAG: right-handed parallel beta-helix repeat-containing protein [Patescibacteria group bacterium]|jgi:hypothetical protein